MNRLYLTDLDHTFLNSNQEISPFSKEIWNNKSKEFFLSVATARSLSKVMEFFNGLTLNSPLILLDGAMTITKDKDIIDLNLLDLELGRDIIGVGEKFNIYPFIIELDSLKNLKERFLVPQLRFMNRYQSYLIKNGYKNDKRLETLKDITPQKNILKIVYMGERELLENLTKELRDKFGNNLELKLAPEKYMDCYFLTILNPKADKSHGLKILSKYLDIPLKDITTFGDSLNDIGMFKLSGTSVAVKNALDEVKREASIVLEYSNDEDGVAKYLDMQ
jgi:Cof subfamily protein (haloacid dehalogenase superfamily)